MNNNSRMLIIVEAKWQMYGGVCGVFFSVENNNYEDYVQEKSNIKL